MGKQNRKNWNLQKAFSLSTIKVCRFEIIDDVKYVYCIIYAYKFLLMEQVGFAAVPWRLRQWVSCIILHVNPIMKWKREHWNSLIRTMYKDMKKELS